MKNLFDDEIINMIKQKMENNNSNQVFFLKHKGKAFACAFFDMPDFEDEETKKILDTTHGEMLQNYAIADKTVGFMSRYMFQNASEECHEFIKNELIESIEWGQKNNNKKEKKITVTVNSLEEAKEIIESIEHLIEEIQDKNDD